MSTSTTTSPEATDRILRWPEVEQRVGVKKSAWYKAIADGRAPKSVRILSSRAVGWRQSDIAALIGAGRSPAAPPLSLRCTLKAAPADAETTAGSCA